MAEGLLRRLIKDRRDTQVMSAGLGTLGGLGPTPETVEVMTREGIDVSKHLGRPVTVDLVERADLILAMDSSHRETLNQWFPKVSSKVFLLKEFQAPGPVKEPDISDPIGQSLDVYIQCLKTIKESVERVAKWLTSPP